MRRLPLCRAALSLVAALALTGCGGGNPFDSINGSGGGGGGGGGGTGPVAPPGPMSQSERDAAMQVLDLVNQQRAANQLGPVVWDEAAATAAYGHAYDMAARNYFDHYSPEGQGPGERLAAQGITGYGWGENIAWGQQSPAEVMNAWMNSPGHRANILNGSYTTLGVGVVLSSGPMWVQDFVAK